MKSVQCYELHCNLDNNCVRTKPGAKISDSWQYRESHPFISLTKESSDHKTAICSKEKKDKRKRKYYMYRITLEDTRALPSLDHTLSQQITFLFSSYTEKHNKTAPKQQLRLKPANSMDCFYGDPLLLSLMPGTWRMKNKRVKIRSKSGIIEYH